MRLLHPNWTSSLVQFGPAALECLERSSRIPGAFTIINTSKDGSVGWVGRGSTLEVFTVRGGQRVAAWCFGAILKDLSTLITAIAEYEYEGNTHLLVATTSSSTQTGLLAMLDINTSRVVKAIEIPNQITSLEAVAGVGADQTPQRVLSEHLRHFCGVVAVGTVGAHIYLLDLNLDDESDKSDEVRPNSVLFLDPRMKDVEGRRISAIAKRKHLCLELNEESHQRGCFMFHRPDRSVTKSLHEDSVSVTAMLYCTQTTSLVVGFSFGCFQLWGLSIPQLEYSSRYAGDDSSPITHFTYQEPENDPQNFVYLWVGHSPLPIDTIEEQGASMSLYQLAYGHKAWHEGLGYVFEKLKSVGPRFEHTLTTTPYNSLEDDYAGSRLLCCYTIQDPHFTVPDRAEGEDSFDDGSLSPDISLCAFVWESAPTDPQLRSHYYLGVFDMNRWYHAQMPHSLRFTPHGHGTCPYLAFYSLESVAEACVPDSILHVYIGQSTLARYQSCIVPVPEAHLYPSSLSFDAITLTEAGVLLSKFPGLQREILGEAQRVGPGVLRDPTDLYNLCMYAGLLPRTHDLSIAGSISSTDKRMAVLNIALEHNMLAFITACIHEWASGEFVQSGCTLRLLLDWAWGRVGHIKESMDKLCVVLYDWSGLQLDAASTALLHQHQVSLQHLANIMEVLRSLEHPNTEQGQADLDTKVMVVQLIESHLSAVVWCYTAGLLPEVSEEETTLCDGRYAFPAHHLKLYFSKRRHEISNLNSELQGTELLMIDGILEQAGHQLQDLWEREGSPAGHYPPLSFHAVLNMYLLEGVPLVTRHSIFFYLLCDLMYLAQEETTEKFEEKMQHFAQAFSLPCSTIRLIQGFWHLDRKEFEAAMTCLLDPIIRSELCAWQHTRIVKALLYQHHHKMALKYIRVKKPPLTTPEDVKMRLTVLLANGLTAEAFEYQRVCRDQGNTEDLLSHLYLGCQQTRTMDRLLQLPLSGEEEHHLVSHMKTTTEPHADEVLVLHQLQRCRVIEALHLHTRLRHPAMGEADSMTRERSLARQSIIDCYHRVLPKAQRKLAFGLDAVVKRATVTRKEVARPVPLSMYVNRAKRSEALSHAALISTVLEKVREVKDWTEEEEQQQEQQQIHSGEEVMREDHPGPFTCTPITPRARSRISEKTEVVYPAVIEEDMPVYSVPLMSPSRRRSYTTASPLSSSTLMDSFRPADISSRRLSRGVTSAASLTMLQTPPVRKRTPSKKRISAPPSAASTPQSILKVRHRAQHIQSPLVAKSTNFDVTTDDVPTPRRLNMDTTADLLAGSSFTHTTQRSLLSQGCSSATSTPKQIRFSVPASPALPGEDRTPSPQPEVTLIDDSPLRSSRDRSPTPERNSPKVSPHIDVISSSMRRRKLHPGTDVAMETDEATMLTNHYGEEEEDVSMEEEQEEEEKMDVLLPAITVNQLYEEQQDEEEETGNQIVHRHYEEQEEEVVESKSITSKLPVITHFEEQQTEEEQTEEEQTEEEEQTAEEEQTEEEEDAVFTDKSAALQPCRTATLRVKKVYYEEMSPVPAHRAQEEEKVQEEEEVVSETQVHYVEEQGQEETAPSVQITLTTPGGDLASLSPTSTQEDEDEMEEAPAVPQLLQSAIIRLERVNAEDLHLHLEQDEVDSEAMSETAEEKETADIPDTTAPAVEEESSVHQFKEPPQPSRVLPPTPPKSGVTTPTHEVTPPKSDLPARSTRGTTPPRSTRATTPPRSTRATTPPRSTRATTPPRTTRATTPPRSTRARKGSVSRDEHPAEPVTPPRVTRGSSRATTPTRSTHSEEEEEPTTPTRRSTRGSTPMRTTHNEEEAMVESTLRVTQTVTSEEEEMVQEEEEEATTSRRTTRGSTPMRTTVEEENKPRGTTPRRRGRPKKEDKQEEEVVEEEKEEDGSKKAAQGTTPRRRGRPRKEPKDEEQEEGDLNKTATRGTTPRRRGRPKKEEKQEEEMEQNEAAPSTRGRRGTTPLRTTPAPTASSRAEDVEMQEEQPAPARATRGTTPRRRTRASESQEAEEVKTQEDRASSRASTPPGRSTRKKAGGEVEVTSVVSSSRSRTDSQSLSDAASSTPYVDDDSASLTSISSRPSRGRPSSRSSSPTTTLTTDSSTDTHKRPPTPTRRSTRRVTQEVVTEDLEKALEQGEGLLSAQAFMMRARRGHTLPPTNSLDVPTEIASDVSSTVTEDDIVERTNFVFSEPMTVEADKGLLAVAAPDPVASFVFSPPITRTRSRRPNDLKSKVKVKSILPDAPIAVLDLGRTDPIKSAKRAKPGPVKGGHDSPINFIPPLEEDDEEEQEKPTSGRRALRQRPMTLRPKKVSKKKRGELKLW